jgi:LmbE family N-acetylglucosaminyl deacetylase
MPNRAAPKILAIHAHPDDVEFQCAGTLARLGGRGCSLVIATMTAGDCGSAELGPLEIAAVRRAEAAAAARLIHAEYHCLEFLDLQIDHDNAGRRRVTEFLRRVRPDLVLTAPPVDYMSDHENTSKLGPQLHHAPLGPRPAADAHSSPLLRRPPGGDGPFRSSDPA